MQLLKNSKIISALICIALLFSLSACASDNDTENEIPSVYEPEVLANSEESNETGDEGSQNINEAQYKYGEVENGSIDEVVDWRPKFSEINWEPELSEEEINNLQYDIALEFLRQFQSIFWGVSYAVGDTFEHIQIWGNREVNEKTIINVRTREDGNRIYDMSGNRITDAPFVIVSTPDYRYHVAIDFELFYLGNNKIPQVAIFYVGFPETCDLFWVLYDFTDGEYQEMGVLHGGILYRNHQGALFTYCGWGSVWFSVVLHEDGINIEPLLYDDVLHLADLLRVRPLTTLKEHITNIITGEMP